MIKLTKILNAIALAALVLAPAAAFDGMGCFDGYREQSETGTASP